MKELRAMEVEIYDIIQHRFGYEHESIVASYKRLAGGEEVF